MDSLPTLAEGVGRGVVLTEPKADELTGGSSKHTRRQQRRNKFAFGNGERCLKCQGSSLRGALQERLTTPRHACKDTLQLRAGFTSRPRRNCGRTVWSLHSLPSPRIHQVVLKASAHPILLPLASLAPGVWQVVTHRSLKSKALICFIIWRCPSNRIFSFRAVSKCAHPRLRMFLSLGSGPSTGLCRACVRAILWRSESPSSASPASDTRQRRQRHWRRRLWHPPLQERPRWNHPPRQERPRRAQ